MTCSTNSVLRAQPGQRTCSANRVTLQDVACWESSSRHIRVPKMATVNCKQQKQTQHDCFTFAADSGRTAGCEPICRHRAQLRLFPSGREGGGGFARRHVCSQQDRRFFARLHMAWLEGCLPNPGCLKLLEAIARTYSNLATGWLDPSSEQQRYEGRTFRMARSK
jgi:hypothetical protein